MPFRTTQTPLVSVVVPVFGTEDFLADCLGSLLRQTFSEIEIIVVDDASPGDVGGVVARVAGHDARVKIVRHSDNQGALVARLTGSRAAIGTYVGFVDSDDFVDDRFIELLHAAATRHDADLVQCAMTMLEPDGKSRCLNRGGSTHALRGTSVLAELLDGKMSNSISNKLIRKDCWHMAVSSLSAEVDRVGRIDFGEDLLTLFFVAACSRTYVHIQEATYCYAQRAGSITKSGTEDDLIRRIRDLNRLESIISPRLQVSREPEELKKKFFQREFELVKSTMAVQLGKYARDPSSTKPWTA